MRIRNNSGFSLAELITIMGILSVLAVIAVPNMIGWRSGKQIQGAVENLRGDLQMAKLKAVQENGPVAILFGSNSYQVFLDDGANEGAFDAGERLLRDRQLPPGVSIDLFATGFGGLGYARFNTRGLPENTGNVVMDSSNGETRTIGLNRIGRVNMP
ncbi:MAG: GspH/FimT family pseudopilin [Deltaproteobacteria bacterium]|jgi:type IV fimbrial biogenesis protein FimT|nr:GspH/FimT family pseudopilin [Deltaproteobacteria bacterium]